MCEFATLLDLKNDIEGERVQTIIRKGMNKPSNAEPVTWKHMKEFSFMTQQFDKIENDFIYLTDTSEKREFT